MTKYVPIYCHKIGYIGRHRHKYTSKPTSWRSSIHPCTYRSRNRRCLHHPDWSQAESGLRLVEDQLASSPGWYQWLQSCLPSSVEDSSPTSSQTKLLSPLPEVCGPVNRIILLQSTNFFLLLLCACVE